MKSGIFGVGVENVYLTIGTNREPVYYFKANGVDTVVIGFEPDAATAALIGYRDGYYTVLSAVSNFDGLATFNFYNNGYSSSLGKANADAPRIGHLFQNSTETIVPVISLQRVLEFIPSSVKIRGLVTDLQGYDYDTVCLGAKTETLRRVPYIFSEVTFFKKGTYIGKTTDICDFLPCLRKHGFISGGFSESTTNLWISPSEVDIGCSTNKWPDHLMELETKGQGLPIHEGDAYFIRDDVKLSGYDDEYTDIGMPTMTMDQLKEIFEYHK